jgi:hypothetical protein
MKKRKIIPYNPKLKAFARKLRNNSTFTEILLWNYLKGKQTCLTEEVEDLFFSVTLSLSKCDFNLKGQSSTSSD